MRTFILFFAIFFNQLNAQITAKDPGADVEDAQFPGGHEKLNDYISLNLAYPEPATVRHVEGAVIVTFTVDTAGAAHNPKVRKGLGNGCDEEALRLVRTMPQWQPARLNGKPIATGKTLKIDFKMPH